MQVLGVQTYVVVVYSYILGCVCVTGSEPLQREELPNYEHPRENFECAGLSGKTTHTHTHPFAVCTGVLVSLH